MRAISRQLCRVCGWTTSSKADMEEHIEVHGKGWHPAVFTRAKDQREFKPGVATTPWGKELR